MERAENGREVHLDHRCRDDHLNERRPERESCSSYDYRGLLSSSDGDHDAKQVTEKQECEDTVSDLDVEGASVSHDSPAPWKSAA